jgi:hypothetical protein
MARLSQAEALGKLFGGVARVRLLRFFLFNPDEPHTPAEIASRLKLTPGAVKKELPGLARAGFIMRKSVVLETGKLVRGKAVRKKKSGWALDPEFPSLVPLRQFLLETALRAKDDVAQKIRPVGKLRLVIISGIFTGEWDSRLDLLIVGEAIRENQLQNAIKSIEAEIGRELRYAILSTRDFYYRSAIKDRLIRDVIDFRHERVIDRLGLL